MPRRVEQLIDEWLQGKEKVGKVWQVKGLWKKIADLRRFFMELVVYACFVYVYFLLVLHYLGHWIKEVFDSNKLLYAIMAVGLIAVQGIVLERLTSWLLRIIQRVQGFVPALRRLARPHETVTRPEELPGSLVYRFAGPLFFFNVAHFANRVQALVDSAAPPVDIFLIDAEAIVDMDLHAAETLAELQDSLREQNIVLGICAAKGHFQTVLLNTPPLEGLTFNLYSSVEAAVMELEEGPKKIDSIPEGQGDRGRLLPGILKF